LSVPRFLRDFGGRIGTAIRRSFFPFFVPPLQSRHTHQRDPPLALQWRDQLDVRVPPPCFVRVFSDFSLPFEFTLPDPLSLLVPRVMGACVVLVGSMGVLFFRGRFPPFASPFLRATVIGPAVSSSPDSMNFEHLVVYLGFFFLGV